MSAEIIKQLLLFFVMPTFFVGILATYLSYRSRVNVQRKTINIPIDSSYYEWKNFFKWGILPGLLISAISFGVGIPVTWEWIIIFEMVSLLFLILFGYRLIHPLFTMSTATGIYLLASFYIPNSLSISKMVPSIAGLPRFFETILWPEHIARNVLIILTLIIFAGVFVLQKQWNVEMNPRFMKSPRGKIVARYRMKPFWLLPLLMVVPGDIFTRFIPWWPTFGWGDNHYSFVILPVLIGLRYTVQAQDPLLANLKIQIEFMYVGILSAILASISYFYPHLAIYFLGILFACGIIVLWRHRIREQRWHFQYGPGADGLRVVAVRVDSPAERMGIQAGDELLVGNDIELKNVETFYGMLLDNRSYVKLKVRQLDGEIMIAQTPIYEEDAYDLGIVLLDNVELK
ncbi:PDZ domain-containing protein [Allofustis seminis]|uniref:PDZ domain-containing protein n=1 Tax=Allofustis seminis TaxID=166939 RepID=UPI00035E2104|nr:PDZ domain-containing protein [Allofustis seminis]